MKVNSYAKINLTLEILKKRDDGYHNLRSIMQLIDLHDILDISLNENSNEVKVQSSNSDVPLDCFNTCLKAANLFLAKTGIKSGINIYIEKYIPLGGGLGGGSSNAAKTLETLNSFFDKPLSDDELIEIAKSIGADVPFFLDDIKTALCENIGDQIIEITTAPPSPIILFFPDINSNTVEAYNSLDLSELKLTGEKTTFVKQAIEMDFFYDSLQYLCNDFEKSIFRKYPVLAEIKEMIKTESPSQVLMSGSGSTVFAIFKNSESRDKTYDNLRNKLKCVKSEFMI